MLTFVAKALAIGSEIQRLMDERGYDSTTATRIVEAALNPEDRAQFRHGLQILAAGVCAKLEQLEGQALRIEIERIWGFMDEAERTRLLQSVWKRLSADRRAALVAQLSKHTGLTAHDLEEALKGLGLQ